MAAPIPERLLVDTATVREPDGSADYAGSTLDPYEIGCVRLDPEAARQSDTWHDDASQQGATLFIDAALSSPAKTPAMGSRVTVTRGTDEVYDGMVTGIRPCLDESGIHHWEVTLS